MALHLVAVLACAAGLYIIASSHLPPAGMGTLSTVAALLLFGFVSVLKLIGSLIATIWHGLWLIKGCHSMRKRQLELWVSVILLFGFAVALFAEGIKGLYTGSVLYPFSRHVGHVTVSDMPVIYWLSEFVLLGFSLCCVGTIIWGSSRLLNNLPPNPAVQGTPRDKSAQRP